MYNCKICNAQSKKDLCWNCERKVERIKAKQKCINYLGSKCSRCGFIGEEYLYDFHHISSDDKEFSIGNIIHDDWEKLKKELDKCELLCAFCHRRIHAENNGYKDVLPFISYIPEKKFFRKGNYPDISVLLEMKKNAVV